MRTLLLIASTCLAVFVGRSAAADLPGIDVHPVDMEGRNHDASEPGASAIVWLFIAHDCPICNGYTPLVSRLAAEYQSRGVRVNVVYAEPELNAGDLRTHAKTYGLDGPLFADPALRLAKAFGITTTPEVAVLDRRAQLAYRGRIDDLYSDIGHKRLRAQTQDLRDAIEAILAGRPVTHPRTQSVGCTLEYPTGASPVPITP
jgi:hypothetical protein